MTPAKEKSSPSAKAAREGERPRRRSGGRAREGERPRGPPRPPAAPARRPPDSRDRASERPCRRPRRRRRRACCRAPRSRRGRSTRASRVWPPLAIRHTNGGSKGSPSPRSPRPRPSPRTKLAATCPCRWSTAANGSSRAAAIAFALESPTSSAPIRPGPWVAATSSTSSRLAAGPAQGLVDDGVDQLEVMARGDLRHHPAEAGVLLLRGDHVGADRAVLLQDRRAGVVAARLDREDAHGGEALGTSSSDPARVGGRAPHDECVLPVVLVVAAAQPRGAEALALVQVDGNLVGGPHLEREAGVLVAHPLVQLGQQGRGQPLALVVGVDRHVHHVPDGVVAGADQVADQPLAFDGGQADARGLGQLEHEHRQRPRGREHAPLDRRHLGQVRVAEAADLDPRRKRVWAALRGSVRSSAVSLGVRLGALQG